MPRAVNSSSQENQTTAACIPHERIRLPSGKVIVVHRLDRCYPVGCGNKGPKLIPRLETLKANGVAGVVTIGGAFSNHVHALAALGASHGLDTAAVIRGTDAKLCNPTLSDARRWGMRVHTVDRKTYATRYDPAFRDRLEEQFPGFAFVQEGGNDADGEAACFDFAQNLAIEDGCTLVVPSGTGATAAGLARGLPSAITVMAADVVGDNTAAPKPDGAPEQSDARFGGYGRVPDALLRWLARVYAETGVLFDPLYNGKAAYWCDQHHRDGLHLLHTGGLQGWRGFASQERLTAHPALEAVVAGLRY